MMFVRKQAGLLRSARSWGVLGLALALAITVGYGQGDKQSPQVTQSGLLAVESSASTPMGAGSYSRHARKAALAQQPPPCVQAPSDLVAWWPLDETSGTNAADIWGSPNHNGTVIGPGINVGGPANPGVPPAQVNGQFYFVPNFLLNQGYVSVPPHADFDFVTSGNFSIDAWVNKVGGKSSNDFAPIVDKRDPNSAKGYMFAVDGTYHLRFFLGGTGYQSINTLTKQVWYHVAVTVDRSTSPGTVTLYINGTPEPTTNLSPAEDATSGLPLLIGGTYLSPSLWSTEYALDEVEIFNRTLSEDEIKSIFSSGSAGKCKPTLLPDLTINKQVMCSGPVTPQGIKCTITFTITNNGPGTFNGILVINDTVTPPPSPGISWAGPSTPAGWNCGISPPNSIGCSSAAPGGAPASVTLGPIGSTTFSVDVYIPNGQYKNCVEVKGYTQFPYTPSTLIQEVTFANNQHCVDFQSGELKKCDLEISKSLAHGIVPPLQPGQQVTFEIIVTNVGTGPCDPPIPVTDTFTGMTYQSGGQIMGPWTCPPGSSATPVTCNYSGTSATPLQPGQSSNFFVNFTVTAKPGEAVENCAEVKHPNDTNPNNNKACIKVPVAEPKEKCDLKITKTVQPNPVPSGQQVTVTLTVQNVGTGPCGPDTVVQDPPTTGLTVPSQQVGVSQSGGTATWGCLILGGGVNCVTASTLPVGYTATFTFTATVTVAPPPGGVANIQNCATVNNPNDPLNPANPGNNQSCVTLQVQGVGNPMDLALVKLLDGQIRVEQEATYVLRVTNVGGRPTTGPIVVSDPLPSGLRFVSASGPGWSCSAEGQNVTCRAAGPIQPGQTSTILLRVRVAAPAGTQITNCATVETAGDANPANNRACHTGTVQR
jgi:uncharacterized repeat protein (TIGR01451 family)